MRKWSLVVAVVAAACGAAQDAASGVVKDAGGWLVEAGAVLQDAGERGGDAARAQTNDAEPKSGSRLEVRVDLLDGADGSRHSGQPYAYDTKRGERCSGTLAADGKTRCLPVASTVAPLYFSDAACTKPLLLWFRGCEKPSYLSAAVADGQNDCAVRGVRIFESGSEFVGNIYAGSSASCGSQGPSSEQPYLFLSLGAEIHPSEFVLLTDAGHVVIK
jgi:hypothetical protein